ncbi:uncharacterized protein LOC108910479 [Anoplophora glabripennis]|uniref:uncharacterized protein LOC108910479 n=1 Tax=Anoplophora glabripennis TaxID=217634 RepID=UPI0008739140|nr:uncharacterized protein LOC108910479 [Anoplophora glabripennis]
MHLDGFSLCASVLVLCCALSVGNCLECYHCNITMSSASKDDPCNGKATLQKCQDPAVCLAAKYSYQDSSLPATTTTLKTCYLNLGGKECQIFLQNIRTVNSATAKIDFSESCVTCSEDGCNHEPEDSPSHETTTLKSAGSTVSASFFISLLLLITARFL